MAAQRIAYLIQQCIHHRATLDERRELLDYANNPAYREQFLQSMATAWEQLQPQQVFQETDREILLDYILAKEAATEAVPANEYLTVHFLKRTWVRYAAAIIVLLGMGLYWFLVNKQESGISAGDPVAEIADIPPGREGAILTLADGRQVVLDSLGNGVIAVQNGTQVVLNNGELSYASTAGASPLYNHLTTPKGRQFQLLLPDGTKVWMNAASSLRYPTIFTGGERRVEVEGEVFFEVAPQTHQPFIVNVRNRMQVRVLGTRFNVNAYPDENAIKTTLVEGSLKIISGDSLLLHPGQQAVLDNNSTKLTRLNEVNMDKVLAWKTGVFNFEDAGLQEVMRQIERWYDIEVVYEQGVPAISLGGKLSNDVSLSGLLKSLQESELHFRMEGRKLIVLP